MNIETAVKLAKPFVGPLTKKIEGRPILKTALVTEDYVIATNSHFLIKIKHGEKITDSYLHHYKNYDETSSLDAAGYPKTERLIPDRNQSDSLGILDTKEMLEAIEGACVTVEANRKIDGIKGTHVKLNKDNMIVKPHTQAFETGEYTYTFDKSVPVPQETCFNPAYLKTIFKTFKAAKENTIDSYYYSPMRPWYLVAGNIEIILLPVRVW